MRSIAIIELKEIGDTLIIVIVGIGEMDENTGRIFDPITKIEIDRDMRF